MKLHIVLHVPCQRGEKCVHAVQATVEQEGCKTDGEGGLFLLQLNVFSCTSQELNKELSGKKENGLISEASSNFLILSLSGIFMRLAWRGCFMTRIGCQELGGGDLGLHCPGLPCALGPFGEQPAQHPWCWAVNRPKGRPVRTGVRSRHTGRSDADGGSLRNATTPGSLRNLCDFW